MSNLHRALRFARVEFYMCRWHGYGLRECAESALAVALAEIRKTRA